MKPHSLMVYSEGGNSGAALGGAKEGCEKSGIDTGGNSTGIVGSGYTVYVLRAPKVTRAIDIASATPPTHCCIPVFISNTLRNQRLISCRFPSEQSPALHQENPAPPVRISAMC